MDKNFQVERDILIYAMRYALGRMTFAPTTVIENIKYNIELFSNDAIKLLIKDIEEFGDMHSYGMECDKRQWLMFKNELEKIVAKEEEILW